MVKAAIQEYDGLRTRDFDIIAQGSYPNNTNARTTSDVDLCVVFKDVFLPDYSYLPEAARENLGYVDSDRKFPEEREAVGKALTKKFGSLAVKPGNKAFDIRSVDGSRVEADVVPAWRFRGFTGRDERGTPVYNQGIVFWSLEGQKVINFPEQHLTSGTEKNTRTNGYYKRAVRILKHVRYKMLDEEVRSADGVSSFLLECMIYNVPDDVFFSSETWRGTMQNVLHHMYQALRDGSAASDWVEVSGGKWLFSETYGIQANWKPAQAQAFVLDAYNRIIH